MLVLTTDTVTSVVGLAPRVTVKVSVVAVSLTMVDPLDSTKTTPQVSSSTTVAVTIVESTSSYESSLVASSTDKVMTAVESPSSAVSLTAVRVIV